MKAAVVYESMYGNTHSIAEATAEGLGSAGAADVVSVEEAARMDLSGLDLRRRRDHARAPHDADANTSCRPGGLDEQGQRADCRSEGRHVRLRAEQDFDGAALVHSLVALGCVIEGQL